MPMSALHCSQTIAGLHTPGHRHPWTAPPALETCRYFISYARLSFYFHLVSFSTLPTSNSHPTRGLLPVSARPPSFAHTRACCPHAHFNRAPPGFGPRASHACPHPTHLLTHPSARVAGWPPYLSTLGHCSRGGDSNCDGGGSSTATSTVIAAIAATATTRDGDAAAATTQTRPPTRPSARTHSRTSPLTRR
ncbi:hypothetical protein BC827DRAFT_1225522 [Russula dissimulans]|nr:hypothetical protein BC827DRAFT_1225522 [Russula dissimulans]